MVGLLSLMSTGTATLRGDEDDDDVVVGVVVDSIQWYGDDEVKFVFTNVVVLLLLSNLLAVK